MPQCIKVPLGRTVGLDPSDIVLDGDPAPLPIKGADLHPQLSAHVYCGQTDAWINMKLGTEVGLGRGDIMLDGTQLHFFKRAAEPTPIFGRVYCAQTAGWIKMPLGMEVGFGPGHVVLHGDPASAHKGHSSPIFGQCLL